jgi:hypothetical protein
MSALVLINYMPSKHAFVALQNGGANVCATDNALSLLAVGKSRFC